MRGKKSAFERKNIARVAWFGVFLAVAYAYWLVMTNFVIRDFWDPAYVMKIELLKARMAQYPGRPVWVVFGSSHVHDAVAPDTLPQRIADGKSPLLFNFGQSGADLFYQLVCLRRMVGAGIMPARAGIEFDMLLNSENSPFADDPARGLRARADELGRYAGISGNPGAFRRNWLESRLNPFYEHGMKAPAQALPLRLVPLLSHFEKQPNSPWGWLDVPSKHPPAATFAGMAHMFATFDSIGPRDPVPAAADRVLRELIQFCASRKISLFLIRMPEAESMRADNLRALAAIQDYLDKISRDDGVQVIDARAWVPDEGFFDPHHLDATGAEQFTRKLAETLYTGSRE